MAYDEGLAERLREIFQSYPDVAEKKMFGGLAFMVQRHMCCGILGEDLMVRVGAEQQAAALTSPHVRPMDFTGRPMKGYIYVAPEGYEADADLKKWVEQGVAFVQTLPPKKDS